MKSHLPFAHQSCFIAIGIMKQLLYDTSFKICADYHFFYKLYFVKKAKFKYLDDIISIYEAEQGLSAVNYLNLKKEIGKIHGKNNDFYWRIYIRVLNYYLKITSVVKSYMPRKCLVCYHKLRYR